MSVFPSSIVSCIPLPTVLQTFFCCLTVKLRITGYCFSQWSVYSLLIYIQTAQFLRDLRLPPRLNWILPSTELVRCVRWFESDVSGLLFGPIFKCQNIQKPLEIGPKGTFETSDSNYLTAQVAYKGNEAITPLIPDVSSTLGWTTLCPDHFKPWEMTSCVPWRGAAWALDPL
jgi:hypothetical protein